ncbi:MAG TPA: tRNA lysidine(34) synthetase TilS [Verrucomicrobiae bacterium]|nr:tRNA lysidine(34) synthetase TilS [Verrucomicrobiae bacterium]
MLHIVRKTILEYGMVQPGDLVVLGVSGGPDSMAMLHCLYRLKDTLQCKLHVVHINHGLREEAEEEARFVQDFAMELGVGFSLRSLDPVVLKAGSLQELAREGRRQILLEECQAVAGRKIALGHNANDQAETVLQRLLRGGGTTGLGGIHPMRLPFIRPLIFIMRDQIEDYLRKENLPFRLDKSNLKSVYMRNKIRLELLPQLEHNYNPRLVEALGKTALVLQEEDQFLDNLAHERFGDCVKKIENGSYYLPKAALSTPPVILRRVIRMLFSKLADDPRGLNFEHVARIVDFGQVGISGGVLELPNGIKVYKEQEGMYFTTGTLAWPEIPARVLTVPGETDIPECNMVVRARVVENPGLPLPEGSWSIVIDYGQVPAPLIIRGRNPGDKVFIKGSYRKTKEIFSHNKIPVRLRETSPVVAHDSEVIWVPGLLRSEKFQVRCGTTKVLELVVTKY